MAKSKPRQMPRRAKAVLAASRSRKRRRVKERLPRFEVDASRRWHIARCHARWSRKVADELGRVGIPSFQAREEVEVVRPDGRRRLARVPLLRRLLFVGVASAGDLSTVERHPGIGAVLARDGHFVEVAAGDLQAFADEVNGHGIGAADERLLFRIGERVLVADGPFASFPGVVEAVDCRTGVYKVGVAIFGRSTPVELDERQIRAA